MNRLRHKAEALDRTHLRILFLLPCHATPYWFGMHGVNASMRFPDCSPEPYRQQVAIANEETLRWLPWPHHVCPPDLSERACLELRPHDVLAAVVLQGRPTHIVLFQPLENRLATQLQQLGYRKERSLWNCLFQVDDDYACRLSIWS